MANVYGGGGGSPSAELQVPAYWIDKLLSLGRVGLNQSVKGVLQDSAAVHASFIMRNFWFSVISIASLGKKIKYQVSVRGCNLLSEYICNNSF